MLKRCLKEVKSKHPINEVETRFLSKLLRSKFKKQPGLHDNSEHQAKFKENFWKYCKNNLDKEVRKSPSFSEETCYTYFRNKTKVRNSNKCFVTPPWMDTLDKPNITFNLEPPTYGEVTKIINYMRSSASPCPKGPNKRHNFEALSNCTYHALEDQIVGRRKFSLKCGNKV